MHSQRKRMQGEICLMVNNIKNMASPVDEIKSKLDIVDIIREYVPLKQAGVSFKACCPFHQERTPSFTVSRQKQVWHCFGCGKGGDIFTFISEIEGVDFNQSLRLLADKAQVTLKKEYTVSKGTKERLRVCLADAERFFYAQLHQTEEGGKALGYLQHERGLSEQTIKEWRLGWAPPAWDSLLDFLRRRRYGTDEIRDAGLIIERSGNAGTYYDRFRNRVMFPIHDVHGTCVGFSARIFGTSSRDEPKYINTPQTLLYDKSAVVFGIDQAKMSIREKGRALLLEGNMDVIASHQAGVKTAVGVSGTALTGPQLRLVKRFSDEVSFCFDRDAAGEEAMVRAVLLAWQEEMKVTIVVLGDEKGKDPDEVIRYDVDAWRRASENPEDVLEYYYSRLIGKRMPRTGEEKKTASLQMLRFVLAQPDPIVRDHYYSRIAAALEVSEAAVREQARKLLRDGREKRGNTKVGPQKLAQEKTSLPAEAASRADRLSQRILAHMILNPQDAGKIIIDKVAVQWISEAYAPLYVFAVSYYTNTNDTSWHSFYSHIQKEAPEQGLLWSQIALMSESFEREFVQRDDIYLDRDKTMVALRAEYLRVQKEKSRRTIARLEDAIRHSDDTRESQEYEEELRKELALFAGKHA